MPGSFSEEKEAKLNSFLLSWLDWGGPEWGSGIRQEQHKFRGKLWIKTEKYGMIQLAIYCCKAPGQKGVGSYDCYSYEWHRDMPLGMPKFMSTKLVMLPNHLIFCHTHLLLPSIFPGIRVFSKESTPRIKWPKYWNSSISPSNEYSGLISFRIDGFDLPTVQGPLTSLLQQHSWKVSVLWHSAVLMIHMGLWYISTFTVAPLPFSSFQFTPGICFWKLLGPD